MASASQAAQEQPILKRAFRYGEGAASLEISASTVTPDLRALTQQTLSLAENRSILFGECPDNHHLCRHFPNALSALRGHGCGIPLRRFGQSLDRIHGAGCSMGDGASQGQDSWEDNLDMTLSGPGPSLRIHLGGSIGSF